MKIKKKDFRYKTKEFLANLLELTKNKNLPIRVVYYRKGKRKEMNMWGLSLDRKKKYIEFCLDKFPEGPMVK